MTHTTPFGEAGFQMTTVTTTTSRALSGALTGARRQVGLVVRSRIAGDDAAGLTALLLQ